MSSGQPRAGSLILTSTTLSALGDGLRYTALPLLLLTVGTGAQAVSTAYVVNSLPGVLFVLFGGLLSDRYPSKVTVVSTDLLRFAVSVAFTVALVIGGVGVGAVYVLIFVLAAAEVVHYSALQVFIADALEEKDLAVLNGRVASVTTTANSLAGPGIGATLYSLAPALPFAVDAFSFLTSALCNVTVRTHRVPTPAAPAEGMMTRLGEGFRITFADLTLRWFFVFAVIRGFATAAVLSVLVVFVVTDRGLPQAQYGYALGIGAVGGIVGGFGVSRFADRVDLWRGTGVGNAVFAGSIALLWFASNVVVIGALLAVNLAAAVWTAVVAATYRQRTVRRSALGRVSSVNSLGVSLAAIAGAATAGAFGTVVGVATLFLVLGVAAFIIVVACHLVARVPRL